MAVFTVVLITRRLDLERVGRPIVGTNENAGVFVANGIQSPPSPLSYRRSVQKHVTCLSRIGVEDKACRWFLDRPPDQGGSLQENQRAKLKPICALWPKRPVRCGR